MSQSLPAYFGDFGGQFVPEILLPALEQLEQAFIEAQQDDDFQAEFRGFCAKMCAKASLIALAFHHRFQLPQKSF